MSPVGSRKPGCREPATRPRGDPQPQQAGASCLSPAGEPRQSALCRSTCFDLISLNFTGDRGVLGTRDHAGKPMVRLLRLSGLKVMGFGSGIRGVQMARGFHGYGCLETKELKASARCSKSQCSVPAKSSPPRVRERTPRAAWIVGTGSGNSTVTCQQMALYCSSGDGSVACGPERGFWGQNDWCITLTLDKWFSFSDPQFSLCKMG